ncbi:patatin-like phospholipase family protein [Symmachiella dynata]|uniref:patatin-like phospholipase family protein n=1 Tax=Symmachiella dynata TaxID=2527995 RepID=UPI0030EE9B43
MDSCSTALALGGGGARGLAHLGVIESLLEAEISLNRIVGVSIGSLAGAMYAFNPDIHYAQKSGLEYLLSEEFQRHQKIMFGTQGSDGAAESTGGVFAWYSRAKDYLRANRIFHRVISHPSLLPGLVLRDVVDNLLPDADIADAVIPLSIVAVDLRSGHKVILERGSVREAVRASSSLPGIFPPVEFEGMLLSDVGVFYSLPTTVARSYGMHQVIAVDVSSDMQRIQECGTALDVLMRMDEIGESLFRKQVRDAADLVIRPDVSGIQWFDFSTPQELIDTGRTAGKNALRGWSSSPVEA